VGFLEPAQPWPFPPHFIGAAATASVKSQQITGALRSCWDIIRVLVHFPGCFPIRGGTARIMDGADVWRKGMFGFDGRLMPCTGRCRGVRSIVPGTGDVETSSGSSPSGAPALGFFSPLGPSGCSRRSGCGDCFQEQIAATSSFLSLNSSASVRARFGENMLLPWDAGTAPAAWCVIPSLYPWPWQGLKALFPWVPLAFEAGDACPARTALCRLRWHLHGTLHVAAKPSSSCCWVVSSLCHSRVRLLEACLLGVAFLGQRASHFVPFGGMANG